MELAVGACIAVYCFSVSAVPLYNAAVIKHGLAAAYPFPCSTTFWVGGSGEP